MFTGIVQGLADVVALYKEEQFMTLRIKLPIQKSDNLSIGASIAINGTCLTVTEFNQNEVQFDLIQETLAVTNLQSLSVGDKVNFERAARIGDEIGGHLLSGHVSAIVSIDRIERTDNNCVMWMSAPDNLMQYILPKGFVALNGCSLTIGEVAGSRFNVYLIPETLSATSFGTAIVGDQINLEVDPQTQAVVDTVNRHLINSSTTNLKL